jgi:hypothetical protein
VVSITLVFFSLQENKVRAITMQPITFICGFFIPTNKPFSQQKRKLSKHLIAQGTLILDF